MYMPSYHKYAAGWREVSLSKSEGTPRHRSDLGPIPTLKGARPKTMTRGKIPLSWPRSCQA